VRHGSTPSGAHRWLQTSCAHRLRKHDRTNERLTFHVARRARGDGLLPASQRPPLRVIRRPHGGTRHARLAGTSAGLARCPPNEPERLPSARLGSCDPSGILSHALLTCTAFSPHPITCLDPCPSRQRLADRFRLSRSRMTPTGQDAPHRLLQPTHNTSTLRTVRFPIRDGHLGAPTVMQPHTDQRSTLSLRVKVSLDGEPPASA